MLLTRNEILRRFAPQNDDKWELVIENETKQSNRFLRGDCHVAQLGSSQTSTETVHSPLSFRAQREIPVMLVLRTPPLKLTPPLGDEVLPLNVMLNEVKQSRSLN